MKHYSIFALLIFFSIGFFSCQEKDELSPNQLEGVYEFREFIDSLGLWSVSTYDFKANGTYQFYITMRNTEEGTDLGFRRFLNAKYQWNGQVLSYQPENGQGIPFGSDELYRPKSQLDSFDSYVLDYFRELKASLDFTPNKEKMTYLEIYPETWQNEDLPKTFIRVNR